MKGSELSSLWYFAEMQLEREIASFLEKEAGVIFPSGWMACMAPLKALATKGDVIFIDEASHDSFKTGARDSRAKVIKFKSNEPTALKRLISKHRKLYASAFIVIEAVSNNVGASETRLWIPLFNQLCITFPGIQS